MHRMKKFLRNMSAFVLLLILIFPSRAVPESVGDKLKLLRIGSGEGFPQITITCIHQDSKGFMWFGTQNGLNKYDGRSFTIYRYKRGSIHSPGHRHINAIYEDGEGFMWICTRVTLDKFDPRTETFTHYPCKSENSPDIPFNVLDVCESSVEQGVLWIGSSGGLQRFHKTKGTFSPVPGFEMFSKYSSSKMILQLEEQVKGTEAFLWFANPSNGLGKYDIKKKRFSAYKHSPSDPNSLCHNLVATIVKSRYEPGILWVGTLRGLDKFDTGSETFVHYRHDPGNPQSLSRPGVRTLYECTREPGVLWVGTWGGGLDKLDTRTGSYTHYRNNSYDFNSLSDNYVRYVYQSPSGVVWIGTNSGGLNKTISGDKKFSHFYTISGSEGTLSNNYVNAIIESPLSPGIFWIGTQDGLNRFERRTGGFTVFRRDPGNPHSPASNLINALYQTSSNPGVLWLGMWGRLDKWDLGKNTFVHYWHDPTDPHSLSNDLINCIYESPSQPGTLWIGSWDGTLHTMDMRTGTFTHYPVGRRQLDGLPRSPIYTIYESPSRPGTLWIGTGGRGLVKFLTSDNTYSYLPGPHKDDHSISGREVFCIHESSVSAASTMSSNAPGVLWLGTGMGLLKFNTSTESLYYAEKSETLHDRWIASVSEDDEGYLWLVTSNALVKFDPRSGGTKSYDVKDGLQGNGYTFAACQSSSGELLVGGTNGFNAFFPSNVKDNPFVPPVVITDFLISNEPVKVGKPGKEGTPPLERNITYTDKIILSYKVKTFSFEFAALSYSLPGRNRYAYKMKGFDNRWNYIGNKRTATFTGLDPGRYTFTVRGSNNDGVWNETGASIRVIIRPPWWRTGWAYVLYGFLLAAAILLLNRMQRARLVRRERDRARIEEVRLQAEAAEAQARAVESENKRKTHELEEARKLQLSMLPKKLPDFPGVEIAVYMKTATEVGGDYYDFYTTEDGSLIVAVGDATGHGLKAGMMVSIFKSLFLSEASTPDPAVFFDRCNRTIKKMQLGNLFMGLTVLRLREDKGVITAAGMPPVLLARKDEGTGETKMETHVETITLKAPPIGAFSDFHSRTETVELKEGDTLLLFTDGLPECFNGEGEMFGYLRLQELFNEKKGDSPSDIIGHLVEAGEKWLNGLPQGDDITFLVLKLKEHNC
jgi:serine phosphatase RsbU (regulator of sigma subunit)/ligand-binding sensor domain-containing protein